MSHDEQAPLTGGITMGDSIPTDTTQGQPIEQARSPEPSPVEEEKTSDDETKTEEKESKPFISGSKKARESGERQKKLAKTLIDAAKDSEAALQSLKATLDSDPNLEKYLKDHFPREFSKLMNQQIEDEPLFDANAARLQAKAELLAEQLKVQKVDQAEEYAERLGFTVDEAEQLVDLAQNLEGKNIGGIKLNYDQAIKKAAIAIREDKAKAGLINIQGGVPHIASGQIQKDVELDALASLGKKLSGRSPEQIKENLKLIQDNFKDGVLTIPMN